jgi:uncharacterized protein (DUF1778 family)
MVVAAEKERLERLEARLPKHVKDQIEHAAALEGRSITDFVVQAALQAAQASIERHELITLRGEHANVFAEAILNPRPPGTELLDAVKRYRTLTGE